MPGPIRMSAAPARYGLDQDYSAFPTSWALPDGSIVMAWRHGSDHVNSRDGSIQTSWSSDGGRTWTQPATAVPYPGGGIDLRDPSISASATGDTLYLTYFKGTASLAAAGCFLRLSTDDGATWGPESRIDPAQPYAAICAPVITESGAGLLTAYYGRLGTETRDSVFVARSTDGGTTWTTSRVANGQSDGRNYQEPWPVVTETGVTVLFRWNTTEAFGQVRSTDGGTTWTSPAVAFGSATGRPSAAVTGSGALAVIYRRISDGAVLYRASRDEGATWLPPRRGQVITGAGWMTYAGPATTPDGLIFCPVGVEEADGAASRIWLTYISDGPAITPLDDNFPDTVTRLVGEGDNVLAGDDFDRPDSATLGYCLTGQPWVGTGRLADGCARGTGGGAVDFPVVDAGSPDVTVEADLSWDGAAGVGVLLRYRDASNHFLYTAEDNGTKVRFYVRNGGVYYKLSEATSVPVGPATWRRFTATVKGRRFLGFIDGQLVLTVNIGDIDTNLLGSQTRHGLKLNEYSGVIHLCRRFLARS